MDKATIFSNSPKDQALQFEEEGAQYLHVVDLNGAFEGKAINEESVKSIIGAVKMPVQLGGGIRSKNDVKRWLDAGVSRVILGTIAVKNKELTKEICKEYGNKIILGLDAKDGKVATDGWAEDSGIDVIELAKEYQGFGIAAIIYTDIARDGAMAGVNTESTKALAEAADIPIIASGGISSLPDLKEVAKIKSSGVEGVISGRAIYENKFSVKDAISALSD